MKIRKFQMSSDSKSTPTMLVPLVPFKIPYNTDNKLWRSMIEGLLKCLPKQDSSEWLSGYKENLMNTISLELEYNNPKYPNRDLHLLAINHTNEFSEKYFQSTHLIDRKTGSENASQGRTSLEDITDEFNSVYRMDPKIFKLWWNYPGKRKLIYDNSNPNTYNSFQPISNGIREIRGPENNIVARTHYSNGKKNGEEEFWFFCGDEKSGSFTRYYVEDVEVTKGEYEREYKIPSQNQTASALSDFGVIKDISNITKEYLK